jgi:hypothetical protein
VTERIHDQDAAFALAERIKSELPGGTRIAFTYSSVGGYTLHVYRGTNQAHFELSSEQDYEDLLHMWEVNKDWLERHPEDGLQIHSTQDTEE